MEIIKATNDRHWEIARLLFQEYEVDLGVDLCFQGFSQELAALARIYCPPQGVLFLAMLGKEPVGCVAIRPREPGVAEMKRLYIKPEARGRGYGRCLAEKIITWAKQADYKRIVLDTLDSLTVALKLYHSLGFVETKAYYVNPLPGVAYLEKSLG